MDKTREQFITKAVLRDLKPMMRAMGYEPSGSRAFTRIIRGHGCMIWLQKFSQQAAFRVAMSFTPDCSIDRSITEFGDRYTRKDNPLGRQYVFHFLRSDDAVEICVREIAAFAAEVAQLWFDKRLEEADRS